MSRRLFFVTTVVISVSCGGESARAPTTVVTPAPSTGLRDDSKPPSRIANDKRTLCDQSEAPTTCPEGYERPARWLDIPRCLEIGYPSVGEHTSLAELRNRALARADAFWECAQRATIPDGLPSGMVTLRFAISPEGKATSTTILSGDLGDDAAECMKDASASIDWPKTELGLASVVLPILIRTRKAVEDPNASCQPAE